MAKIETYISDNNISDKDVVLGSDGDLFKKTKNYTVGGLKRYITSDFSASEQNNIPKSINLGIIDNPNTNISAPEYTANSINSLPPFVVNSDEIYFFTISVFNNVFVYTFKGIGKGNYGVGNTQINQNQLQLISKRSLASTTIEDETTTDVFTLGNIDPLNVSEAVNNINPPIDIQPLSDGFTIFKSIEGGANKSYVYRGQSGLTGVGANQTVLSDFDLIPQEETNQGASSFTYINTNNVPETIGGYEAGIPATPITGLSGQEALDKLLFPALPPTINSFTASPQPEYNQPTPYNINVDWDVTINTVGATLDTLLLEWRRGNSGVFTQLTTDTQLTNFTHQITAVDNQNIQYRLTVTDSSGETQTQTITRTVQGYVAPSGSITKLPSANTIERGVDITTNGSITRNRQFAIINNVKFQKRINGGAWSTIEELASADLGASITLSQHTSVNGNDDSNVQFRMLVTDNGNSNDNQIAFTETNLILPYFYGKSTNNPTINQALFTGSNKVVADSNGTLNIVFNASSEFLWFAIPENSTPKTNWFVTALNAGNIGSSTDLWGSPVDFVLASPDGLWTQNYKVYVTNNPTSTINGEVMELRN